MGIRYERTFNIDAPPEAVAAAMRNPELINESEMSRDALGVEIKDKLSTDSQHDYEVWVTTHARTVKGIDKSKSETNHTEVTWDLRALNRRWTYRDSRGKLVDITGNDRVVASGNGTSLQLCADINISIPIAGRVLEKKVKAGFEETWPKYVALITKYATRG